MVSTLSSQYIAASVRLEYTEAQHIQCKARVDLVIGGIEIKAGTVFHLVRSSKNDGTYYLVRWNDVRIRWECSCQSHKECKHLIAVNALLVARYQRERITGTDLVQHVEDDLRSSSRMFTKSLAAHEESARFADLLYGNVTYEAYKAERMSSTGVCAACGRKSSAAVCDRCMYGY